jgi:hypothetical protein
MPSCGNIAATSSTYGTTWSCATLPYSTQWSCVCVNGNMFVAIPDGTQNIKTSNGIYSINGTTWNTFNLPSCDYWVLTSGAANTCQFYAMTTTGKSFAVNF